MLFIAPMKETKRVQMQSNIKDTENIVQISDSNEQVFRRAVVQGLVDIEEGREINLEDVKKRFGLGK